MNREEVKRRPRVSARDTLVAVVMLVGIVLVGYGYYGANPPALYAGVILIAGAVLLWVVFALLRKG